MSCKKIFFIGNITQMTFITISKPLPASLSLVRNRNKFNEKIHYKERIDSGYLIDFRGVSRWNTLAKIDSRKKILLDIITSTNKAVRLLQRRLSNKIFQVFNIDRIWSSSSCSRRIIQKSMIKIYTSDLWLPFENYEKGIYLFAATEKDLGKTKKMKMKIYNGSYRPIKKNCTELLRSTEMTQSLVKRRMLRWLKIAKT